jgi:Tol biopolymer transport system component
MTPHAEEWTAAQAVWVDRSGKTLDRVGEPAMFDGMLRLSPNGEKVAFIVDDPQEGTPNLWVYDSNGQQKTRLTFGPSSSQSPTWSPDSNRIVFTSNLKGAQHLFTIPVTGVGWTGGITASLGSVRGYKFLVPGWKIPCLYAQNSFWQGAI